MEPQDQPQDQSDPGNRDETHERPPVQPRNTSSTNNVNHNNPPHTIWMRDDPASRHTLVNREQSSDNVRGRAGQGSWMEVPPQSSATRIPTVEQNNLLLQHFPGWPRVGYQSQPVQQQNMLSQEQTGAPPPTSGPNMQSNVTRKLAQMSRNNVFMPSLRSQPEFYMTGVTTVDTTEEPQTDNAECTICLEPLSTDVVKFNACGHMFHTVCVQGWFDQSAPREGHKQGTCPNCRRALYEPDPQYGHPAPPSNAERLATVAGPVRSAVTPIWVYPAQPTRREETNTTARPSNNRRHDNLQDATQPPARERNRRRQEVVTGFPRRREENEREERARRRSAERAQNNSAVRPPAVIPPPQATTRRRQDTPPGWSELAYGYQLPGALGRARNDPTAREYAASLPPRTSSLPHGGATRRQQASQIMTDALRVNTSMRDEGVDPDAPERVLNDDQSPRTPSMQQDPPSASTQMVNQHPVQPPESRAALAARAIAQRRPLALEPGLNHTGAIDPDSVLAPNAPSVGIRPNLRDDRRPDPSNDATRRAIRDLQLERNLLLGRYRDIQNQMTRMLEETGTHSNRERRAAMVADAIVGRPGQSRMPHSTNNDISNRRPPPIAIPRLADPSVADIRSAREFPDRRATGWGASIWSADYVTPNRSDSGSRTQESGRGIPLLSSPLNPTTDSNERSLSLIERTHSEVLSAEQYSEVINDGVVAEDAQLMARINYDLDRLERQPTPRTGRYPTRPHGPAPADDDAPDALQ